MNRLEREFKAKIPTRRELLWLWIFVVLIQSFNFAADFNEGRPLLWTGVAAVGAWVALLVLVVGGRTQKVRFYDHGVEFRDWETGKPRLIEWEQIERYHWDANQLHLICTAKSGLVPAKLVWPEETAGEVRELMRAYAPLAVRD